MNILVTGGAGYIGSVTAEALLAAGHQVTVLDNLVNGHRAAVPQEAHFVQADVGDRQALDAVLGVKQVDAIVHFAAFALAGESMVDPGKYFFNNTANSATLIEAAVAHNVQRFVFSSSAGVYAAKDGLITEEDPVGPVNVYAQTKLMIEQVLGWYWQIHGLGYAALRYFNAAGATAERGEDHVPETHIIPLTLQVPLGKRDHIKVFGTDYPTPDGSCIRDYIHIEDLAWAHVLTVEALNAGDRLIYNLGTGKGYSVKEVVAAAREVTGHPIPAEETDRRPGDPPILVANAERIRQELGWRPRIPSLHEIIATAWEWHRSHPLGYNDRGERD